MFTKTKQTDTKCAEDVFCGVNTAADIDNATDLEKKHIPVISAPHKVKKAEKFEVTVEVGKLLEHPNEPGLHIEFIELNAGDTYLARMDFSVGTTYPIMKTCVSLNYSHGKLWAFEYCNLHGTWEGDADIEVTE